jgi:hypothetical protein
VGVSYIRLGIKTNICTPDALSRARSSRRDTCLLGTCFAELSAISFPQWRAPVIEVEGISILKFR